MQIDSHNVDATFTLKKALQQLRTNVKYLLRVGNEKVEIEATMVGVIIQGNNLGPILFLYLIQAVATTLDKEMRRANIKQTDYIDATKDGKMVCFSTIRALARQQT